MAFENDWRSNAFERPAHTRMPPTTIRHASCRTATAVGRSLLISATVALEPRLGGGRSAPARPAGGPLRNTRGAGIAPGPRFSSLRTEPLVHVPVASRAGGRRLL